MNFKRFLSVMLLVLGIGIRFSPALAQGDIDAGRIKFQACAECHRDDPGRPTGVPKLAGQHADYVMAALRSYSEGGRRDAGMGGVAAALSEQDMADVAAYVAGAAEIKPTVPKAGEQQPIEKKVENCRTCHGERGNSSSSHNPRLIGQDEAYLLKALKSYRNGERSNPSMIYVLKGFSEQDLAEIAAYYAGQQAGLEAVGTIAGNAPGSEGN